MAKNEIYVCDYELCGYKGINDEGGLPVNWFELTVVKKEGKKTFHLCPKHQVIITDPWGGSWVFDHTKIKDDPPE